LQRIPAVLCGFKPTEAAIFIDRSIQSYYIPGTHMNRVLTKSGKSPKTYVSL